MVMGTKSTKRSSRRYDSAADAVRPRTRAPKITAASIVPA